MKIIRNIQKVIIKKFIFASLGAIFCLLGILGAFLPVLPGIYFILIGIGFLFRAFPSLSIFLKIFRLEDKITENLGLKTKLFIIVGIWSPFLITFALSYLLRKKAILGNPEYLLFLPVFIFPAFLSIWTLKVKNIAEILGYKGKAEGDRVKSRKKFIQKSIF